MNDELSRRAIAAVGWMPGMLVDTGERVLYLTEGSWLFVVDDNGDTRWLHVEDDDGRPVDHALLELADHATLGCIEGRMLASWPSARISTSMDPWGEPFTLVEIVPEPGERWLSFSGRGPHHRAEALVSAIEAAPRREGST